VSEIKFVKKAQNLALSRSQNAVPIYGICHDVRNSWHITFLVRMSKQLLEVPDFDVAKKKKEKPRGIGFFIQNFLFNL